MTVQALKAFDLPPLRLAHVTLSKTSSSLCNPWTGMREGGRLPVCATFSDSPEQQYGQIDTEYLLLVVWPHLNGMFVWGNPLWPTARWKTGILHEFVRSFLNYDLHRQTRRSIDATSGENTLKISPRMEIMTSTLLWPSQCGATAERTTRYREISSSKLSWTIWNLP